MNEKEKKILFEKMGLLVIIVGLWTATVCVIENVEDIIMVILISLLVGMGIIMYLSPEKFFKKVN